jgi:hypothetical protein
MIITVPLLANDFMHQAINIQPRGGKQQQSI